MKLFLLIIGLVSLTTFASEHKHAHHHHGETKGNEKKDSALVLNNGKKWAVDETMRENMDKIHTGLVKLLNLEEKKSATNKDYQELHSLIYSSTEKIIENCKMEPMQDQAYHVILEEMFQVAEDLKSETKQKTASQNLISSMVKYMKFFDQKFHH